MTQKTAKELFWAESARAESAQAELPPAIFTCNDRFGAISLHRLDNIVVSQFKGPCSDRVVKSYVRAMLPEIQAFNGTPWAYMSMSVTLEAFTDCALKCLTDSFARSREYGCVADAYVIKSVLGKEQLRSIREKFETQRPLSEVMFTSFDAACVYLNERLSQHIQVT